MGSNGNYWDLLRAEIDKYHPLDRTSWDILVSGMQPVRLNQGEIFTHAGQQEDRIGFLGSGAMRAFMDINGKEINHDLFRPGNFVSELDAFISGMPSESTIVANQDSELLVISKKDLNNFCLLSGPIESLVRKLFETIHNKKREQEIILRIASAGDKLKYMQNVQPELFRSFKKKEIATYLNIAPETFSRLGGGDQIMNGDD